MRGVLVTIGDIENFPGQIAFNMCYTLLDSLIP